MASADFVLWTDLHEAEGAALLADLEVFRSVLLETLFSGAPTPRKKGLVVAFARAIDWDAFGRTYGAGFFMSTDRAAYNVPALFLPAQAMEITEYYVQQLDKPSPYERRTDPAETRQHELAHMMMDALIPESPTWFDEGVASTFETAKLDAKSRTFTVGALPGDLGTRLKLFRLDDIGPMVHRPTRDRLVFGLHDTAFRTTSHILVSFLLNEHPDLFDRYLRALQAAPAAKRGDVWDEVFADYPANRVQSDMLRWLRAGKVRTFQVPVPPAETGVEVIGPVGDADVYWFRALLYFALGRNRGEFRQNVDGCIAAEPTHVGCNLYRLAVDPRAAVDAAAIVAAHPDDWRAWLLTTMVDEQKGRLGRMADDLRHACELARGSDAPAQLLERCPPAATTN